MTRILHAQPKRSGAFRVGAAILAVVAFASAAATADTVELRDGSLVEGKYVGGSSGTVRIETPAGVKVLQTGDVLAITFTANAAPPAAPAAAAAAPMATAPPAATPPGAPAAAAAPGPVTVPAGTILTVRMDAPVSSKDPPGKKFSAKLLADLTAGNATVAKAGATVFGQVDQAKQAGRMAGKSSLAISLTGVDIGGRTQPILTTNFSEAGKGEFRKTARNVAGGALIGNAIDDDGGAGAGAAVGAGVSVLKKGDAVTIPPGAILEFRLTQPFQAAAQ